MTRLSRRFVLPHLLTTAVLLACAATPAHAQDGAYIVEPWLGSYEDVKIQPGDQKIVVAGREQAAGRVAIARYDSAGNPDGGFGSGGLSIPPGGLAGPKTG